MERSFDPFLGTFGGLASWFSLGLKSAFALVGIGAFLKYFLSSSTHWEIKIIAGLFCVLFVFLNILSIKISVRTQNMMVIFLLCDRLSIYFLRRTYSSSYYR